MPSVFKIEKQSVVLEVELTTGEKGQVRIYLPSTKQTQALLKAGEEGAVASFDNQIELLKANVEGDLKDSFVNDILENGNVIEFFNLVQTESAKQKKKR